MNSEIVLLDFFFLTLKFHKVTVKDGYTFSPTVRLKIWCLFLRLVPLSLVFLEVGGVGPVAEIPAGCDWLLSDDWRDPPKDQSQST